MLELSGLGSLAEMFPAENNKRGSAGMCPRVERVGVLSMVPFSAHGSRASSAVPHGFAWANGDTHTVTDTPSLTREPAGTRAFMQP